jgi:Tol biopolymer transport system component
VFTRDLNLNGASIVTVSADGRGVPRLVVPGNHNDGFCQSADGTQLAFFSDQEAPGEPFLYLANADGTGVRKITEQPGGFWCGFSRRWLLLTHQTGPTGVTFIRHDLHTGANKTVAGNVARAALSPDGTKLVYVGGLSFRNRTTPVGRETLELLDLNTLATRRLAGRLTHQSYSSQDGAAEWSPERTRIAYMVGPWAYPSPGQDSNNPPPAQQVLTVQDVSTGAVQLRLPLRGGPASFYWSPDGNKLLVCLPNRGPQTGCEEGLPDPSWPAELLQVDLASHNTTAIARGVLLWADWSPTGGYGYARPSGIVLTSTNGRVRTLPLPPRRTRAGDWIGFSPDGRFLGLGDFSSKLGVLDLSTGKLHILYQERFGKTDSREALYRKWWREKSAQR